VRVEHSTVNYWLGKLTPTMIVVADTSERRLWYGWIEYAHSDYPRRLKCEGKLDLTLRLEVAPDFTEAVATYVCEWFSRLRDEIHRLPDRVQLTQFSLHVAALSRCLTQLHLALTSGLSIEKLLDSLYFPFLEFGLHDGFLVSLWESDSPWRQPLSSRIAGSSRQNLRSTSNAAGIF
jgi:hypothetical protein